MDPEGVETVRDRGREEEFNRWFEHAQKRALAREYGAEVAEEPCIRASNERYAKGATFEQRLTAEDREMLAGVGIAL